ncbi:shikimate dehydrogenase [Deinococcus sp. Marseille-Q6407]|uniref:shikimate dehydrogenase n=1 Tax=Deinococcus sp. Marseille-Q6407 TaxID=2969223 RepID=UPI0021C0A0D5|nr:shikimate dehydrogenase [Deinococcus sp. Marseille-Q6407]
MRELHIKEGSYNSSYAPFCCRLPTAAGPAGLRTGHRTGGPATAQALRDLGYLALPLPASDLSESLAAAQVLGLRGVLIHPTYEEQALLTVQPDEAAQQARRVDAVALPSGLLAAGSQGTHTLAEALSDVVEAARYVAQGVSALVIGHGSDLVNALPLTRLGLAQVGFAADSLPAAERLKREVPAVTAAYVLSRRDPALQTLAERASLIVVTGGLLPAGVLQAHHTLLDLTGRLPASAAAHRLELSDLPALRLARQLTYLTGQQHSPAGLAALAQAVQSERG